MGILIVYRGSQFVQDLEKVLSFLGGNFSKIATGSKILERNISIHGRIDNSTCPMCMEVVQVEETTTHLLLHCLFSWKIWSHNLGLPVLFLMSLWFSSRFENKFLCSYIVNLEGEK